MRPRFRITAAQRKLAAQLEMDRRRIEYLGVVPAARLGATARRAVMSAYRRDQDPEVIKLVARNQFAKALPLLRTGMVAGHLLGRRRVELSVRSVRPIALASGARFPGAYSDALKMLKARLELDPEELEALETLYEAESLRVLNTALGETEKKLEAAILEATESGLHVSDGAKLLGRAFESSGLVPQNDFTLENLFRTQTQLAYGAGRWNADQVPAVREILWGYRYVTVGDDRVRLAHVALEGTTAPKESEIWLRIWPPNGWSCRCGAIPLFEPADEILPPEGLVEIDGEKVAAGPDPGFSFNAGEIFRDGMGPSSLSLAGTSEGAIKAWETRRHGGGGAEEDSIRQAHSKLDVLISKQENEGWLRTADIMKGRVSPEKAGLTDEHFATVQSTKVRQEVDPTQLIATQGGVKDFVVREKLDKPASQDIAVIKKGGQLYLIDGHHSVSAQILRGSRKVVAKWLDLDKTELSMQRVISLANWDPSQHPRDAQGKFLATGGFKENSPASIIRTLGQMGYGFKDAKKAMDAIGATHISEATIKTQLGQGKKGIQGAKFTPEQLGVLKQIKEEFHYNSEGKLTAKKEEAPKVEPSPTAPVKAEAPKAPPMQTPKSPPPAYSGATHPSFYGHSPASVVRWMGKNGFSVQQAKNALAKIGLKEISDATVKTQLYQGKKGIAGAPLDKDQSEYLQSVKDQAGGAPPKAPSQPQTSAGGQEKGETVQPSGQGDPTSIKSPPGTTVNATFMGGATFKVVPKTLGGSTGAKLVEVKQPHGTDKFVMKQYHGNELQAQNEYVANRLYGALGNSTGGTPFSGADVPYSKLGSVEGKAAVFNPYVEGMKTLGSTSGEEQEVAKSLARSNFVVDAFLANWDAVGTGMDNMGVAKGNKGAPRLIRVDNGGALLFRAQGSPKGAAFGNHVGEIDSLRDASKNPWAHSVYGSITDEEIVAQIDALQSKFAAKGVSGIQTIIAESGMGVGDMMKLSKTLAARMADLIEQRDILKAKIAAKKQPKITPPKPGEKAPPGWDKEGSGAKIPGAIKHGDVPVYSSFEGIGKDPVFEKLSAAEVKAIKRYTGTHSTSMKTDFLLAAKNGTKWSAEMRALTSGIDKSPHFTGWSARGVAHTSPELWENWKSGKWAQCVWDAPSSTSVAPGHEFGSTNGICFIIKHQGLQAGYVGPISTHPGERELMCRPGAKYRVVGYADNTSGALKITKNHKRFIVLEETTEDIPESQTPPPPVEMDAKALWEEYKAAAEKAKIE